MPAVGSSSSSTRGSSASASAMSSSFWSPCDRLPESVRAREVQADQFHHLVGLGVGLRQREAPRAAARASADAR